MGKPTWVEGGGRRPTIGNNSNNGFLNSPDQPPAEPQFPRRYPRTGTAFQCKGIPEIQEEYASTRASEPEPMSVDVPYRTVAEMKAFDEDGSCVDDDNDNVDSVNTVSVSNNNNSNDDCTSLRSKGKVIHSSLSLEHVCLPTFKSYNNVPKNSTTEHGFAAVPLYDCKDD